MSKHTPGPWAKSPSIEGAIAKGKDPLAICFATGEGDIVWMNDADYALAVSAPDLLKALEAVYMMSTRNPEAWDMARAAIARAKGESS